MSRVIAVLITCHNRRSASLACLQALFEQVLPPKFALRVYLVDDGSTDGTADAVRTRFPEVTVIPADGSLFWSGGMNLAWRTAACADPDFYLWLNDDTNMRPGGLATLLRTWDGLVTAGKDCCIVVASCCDPVKGEHTYGGLRRRDAHPARLSPVMPDPSRTMQCDTFEGNSVLIPRCTFKALGFARRFRHSFSDVDYGLFATRNRIPVIIAPDYLAECPLNVNFKGTGNTWYNAALPRRVRWKKLTDRKGIPPTDWWRFLWAHSGFRALLYWPIPYVRVLLGL
jgi:GT2 family glycosyltransferase